MNHFEPLPNEIILNIISFTPSIKDLGRLAITCNRFAEIIAQNDTLWKDQCERFWVMNKLNNYGATFEDVAAKCGKDWFWYSKCFAQPNIQNGFGYYTEEHQLNIGLMLNGLLEGWGISVHKTFLCFGRYLKGHMFYGTIYYEGGAKYEGEVKNHLRNGYGTLHNSNGNVYVGNWRNNLKHGQGIYTTRQGDRYEGEWMDGNKEGEMRIAFCEGDVYHGQMKANQYHGSGTYYYRTGSMYDGKWRNGYRDGYGVMHFSKGSTLQGVWHLNQIKGVAVFTNSFNGSVFEGLYQHGKRNGTIENFHDNRPWSF